MKKLTLLMVCILFAMLFSACTFEGSIESLGTVPIQVAGTGLTTLADKLNWLDSNAESGNIYAIEVTGSSVPSVSKILKYGEKKITVRITGSGFPVNSSSGDTPVFEVGSGVTLVLENIVLKGREQYGIEEGFDPSYYDSAPLVKVNFGATLVMNDGAVITQRLSENSGGGVYVDGGTFIMNGGEISRNTAHDGGGVYVENGGAFVMNGGTICKNSTGDFGRGGGVCVNKGTFTVNSGAVISGNRAFRDGGGIYVDNSNFLINRGIVYGCDEEDDIKNFSYWDFEYPGHAICAYYSVIGESFATLDWRFRDDTVGNEYLGLTLKGSSWSWTGNWSENPLL